MNERLLVQVSPHDPHQGIRSARLPQRFELAVPAGTAVDSVIKARAASLPWSAPLWQIPDPLGELKRSPRTPSRNKGAYF